MSEHHSGFVAIIGRPNVGKSTFMNRILGEKIAIMSPKAQTTRNKINGIYTTPDAQIVFVDTPGIHKPKNELDTYMDKAALSTLNQVDAILFMVEADEEKGPGDGYIMRQLAEVKKPVYLIINKIELLTALTDALPVGPQYYPEDQLTDHPEYFVVGELIREKILELTRDEVPHAVAVQVERMKDREGGKLQIEAYIIVERDSQKGIIIGRGGQMLKQIGIRARRDIENLLGDKVNLKLWVRVQKNWRDNNAYLKSLGYNTKDLR